MILLWVTLGAAIGAPLRYLIDRAVQNRHDSVFPWGTLTVNITGSFVLGLLIALPTGPTMTAVIGTGFCGALTTYSTFGYETLRLTQDRAYLLAGLNILISVLGGIGAAYLGASLIMAISGAT